MYVTGSAPMRVARLLFTLPSPAQFLGRLGVSLAVGLTTVTAGEPVSFRNDVMGVLSKAGCNLGTCHGNARGKGGFQLSLRGQDPAGDFLVLTRDAQGRRTNRGVPEESLMLLKGTMHIAHEGGRRFGTDSEEYRILRDWIAAGLPADHPETPRLVGLEVTPTRAVLEAPAWSQPLQVTAVFDDGRRVDARRRAVYEIGTPLAMVTPDGVVTGEKAGETTILVRYLDQQTPVNLAWIPSRPNFTWRGPEPRNIIDEHAFAQQRALKLQPAPLCDDTTFLRRASFDLIGTLPTAEEARAFVASADPEKRTRLIDALLERPEFASWWALKWADMLRVEEKTLDAKGAAGFHAWLRQAFATDVPLDALVRELLTARGSTYSSPPANFYRALRDPLARSEAVGQLFLGVRLQCARCHNHPFDRWTQDDYYAWGNLFARVDYKILENRRRDDNDKHEFDGEQVVWIKPEGELKDPRTGEPRAPQLLGAGAPPIDDEADRLGQLADWLTAPDNDRFAEMLVNRIWRHLMGRGLVEPVDDFRATNPPSHPALLAALADELRRQQFALKPMLRWIASSATYQLAADPNPTNTDDEVHYSRAIVRRYSAEQLADALSQATARPIPYQGVPLGTRARDLAGVGAMLRRQGGPLAGDVWLRTTGRPQRLQSCECERSDETTLAQAFQLISGELVHQLTTDPANRIGQWPRDLDPSTALDDLFWSALSRGPTTQERTVLLARLAAADDRTAAWQDVLWSLVTSHEFLLRR
jgi:hypothetical protein